VASIRDTNDQREAEGLPPLKSYNLQLADGRELTVDATDEDQAKLLGREQGGNVGVLSVEENTDPDSGKATDADDAETVEGDGDAVTFTDAETVGTTDPEAFDSRPESTGLDASPDGIIAETPTDEGAVINDTPADAPLGPDGLPTTEGTPVDGPDAGTSLDDA
jgi:hypothetical protein